MITMPPQIGGTMIIIGTRRRSVCPPVPLESSTRAQAERGRASRAPSQSESRPTVASGEIPLTPSVADRVSGLVDRPDRGDDERHPGERRKDVLGAPPAASSALDAREPERDQEDPDGRLRRRPARYSPAEGQPVDPKIGGDRRTRPGSPSRRGRRARRGTAPTPLAARGPRPSRSSQSATASAISATAAFARSSKSPGSAPADARLRPPSRPGRGHRACRRRRGDAGGARQSLL